MTGEQLNEEMLKAGLIRDRMFLVNAFCCQPTQNKTETQMRKATLACRPVLLSQLSKFDPRTPVFAMGKYALIGLNGVEKKGGIANARGFVRKEWEIPKYENQELRTEVEGTDGAEVEAGSGAGGDEGDESVFDEKD
jgi:hypothetical protein